MEPLTLRRSCPANTSRIGRRASRTACDAERRTIVEIIGNALVDV
ncbi:DUF1534 domain-containing protein [Pseudomonas syringae pv. theae]|nr:DUF1534 domain-containing protein [Pseudomonas syringae pv. theae]MBL3865581.1 DUF1534 domain-containing protein [Pseudomonas syringae pv. theae]